MIGQRVNRGDPERLFMVFKNNEGATMPKDSVAQLDLRAGSADGVNIVQPNTAEQHAAVGIVDAALTDQSYGLIQVYGYRSTSLVNNSGTSVAVGLPLAAVAGSDVLSTVNTGAILTTFFKMIAVLMESSTSSATSAVSLKIFVRAL